MEIDITEMIDKFIELSELSGKTKDVITCRIMLEAKKEIEALRKSRDAALDDANERNKSRLAFMDMYNASTVCFEEFCNDIMENHRDEGLDYVCAWCQAYSAWEEAGVTLWEHEECPGYDEDRCFTLDRDKFWKACKEELDK